MSTNARRALNSDDDADAEVFEDLAEHYDGEDDAFSDLCEHLAQSLKDSNNS